MKGVEDICTRTVQPWERWDWPYREVMETAAYKRALLSVLMRWAVHDAL